MTKQEILAKVDHTLLKADAGWEDIRRICDEALENSTASICINPCWVERAVEYLGGRVPVCTVIGFPLGATTTAATAGLRGYGEAPRPAAVSAAATASPSRA